MIGCDVFTLKQNTFWTVSASLDIKNIKIIHTYIVSSKSISRDLFFVLYLAYAFKRHLCRSTVTRARSYVDSIFKIFKKKQYFFLMLFDMREVLSLCLRIGEIKNV